MKSLDGTKKSEVKAEAAPVGLGTTTYTDAINELLVGESPILTGAKRQNEFTSL